MKIHIVLHEPEIPQNTGNIARTCAVIGASLHLIKPLGFSLDDKYMKRAGLDYWGLISVTIYENTNDFFEKHRNDDIYYFTTKGPAAYTDVRYPDEAYLMFGRETAGIPEEILRRNKTKCVRIPMKEGLRSLNLSNAAAIAAYEAARQHGFEGLLQSGEPRTFKWEET